VKRRNGLFVKLNSMLVVAAPALVIAALVIAIQISTGCGAAHRGAWYRDPKALAVGVAVMGSSAAFSLEAHECRKQFGISPCYGGYGEIRARDWLRAGTSAGMFGLSLWGRHQGFKEWALPALGFATYNGIDAYRQTIVGCPTGQHFLYGTKFTCVKNYDSW
jgi:hypothetical protein